MTIWIILACKDLYHYVSDSNFSSSISADIATAASNFLIFNWSLFHLSHCNASHSNLTLSKFPVCLTSSSYSFNWRLIPLISSSITFNSVKIVFICNCNSAIFSLLHMSLSEVLIVNAIGKRRRRRCLTW